jgi:hypothetical protein
MCRFPASGSSWESLAHGGAYPSGAGGTVGSLRVAKAPPDGYQFVLGNSGTHAWSQALYKKPPYETLADFTALGLVVESQRVLIVPKTLPANSLPEFIAYVRANQATVKFGSAGAGSASHVSCILLNAALGVDVMHIPYRGLGPAMADLMAGRIDYVCDSVSTSLPQIESNSIKAIASTGARRPAVLPNVATAREQGLDFEVGTWQGLFLPKGTPEPIVRRLNGPSARRSTPRRCASASKRSARRSRRRSAEARTTSPSSWPARSRAGAPRSRRAASPRIEHPFVPTLSSVRPRESGDPGPPTRLS